jgi:hypothetical protein
MMECSSKEIPGPCAVCGLDEPCASWDHKPHCYDCWHRAREATQAYQAVRVDPPEQIAQYGHFWAGISGTLDEATAFAREMEKRTMGRDVYEVLPSRWNGERRSHPGYLARRRASIVAAHPEYTLPRREND